MQNLKLKSIYKFGKSCSSSDTEHNKIGFAIFVFFYDFTWILQAAAKTHQRVKNHFARRPLESFEPSQICPRFAHRPLEEYEPCNWVPRSLGAAWFAGIRRGRWRGWPGKGRRGV
jgi:hypothetical protein